MAFTKLTTEEAYNLHNMQARLQELKMDLEAAERAGLDVSMHRTTLAQVESLRAGLLREFHPSRTPPLATDTALTGVKGRPPGS